MDTKHEVLKEITYQGEVIPVGREILSSDYPDIIAKWMRAEYVSGGVAKEEPNRKFSHMVEPSSELPAKREVLYKGVVLAVEGDVINEDTRFVDQEDEGKEKKIPKKTMDLWLRHGVINKAGRVLPYNKKPAILAVEAKQSKQKKKKKKESIDHD
jgi:RNase P/RNase MRP subunit p29